MYGKHQLALKPSLLATILLVAQSKQSEKELAADPCTGSGGGWVWSGKESTTEY